MKKVAIISSVLLISCFAKAQNDVDALRYSRLDFGGTARYNSLAGAFGSLGGDFSVCSTNPAGIAVYRKSEISFSPSLFHSSTSTNFFQSSNPNDKYNFNFGNFGFVLAGHNDDNDKNDWRGFAMGIGYNRLANFNSSITIQGKDTLSTMLNVWRDDAQTHGKDTASFDQFGTAMAYSGGLIGQSSPGNYFAIIQSPYGEVQRKDITRTGAVGETVFTLGGNYKDKLFIGGTIGMPRIRYSEESTYTETVAKDTIYNLKDYSYKSSLTQTGTGINVKFGAILKPVEWLRIGAAVHSPSFFHMQDQYSNSLHVDYTNGNYQGTSPQGSYNYTLTTPMRGILSMAYIYKNIGLISVDYEMVNYANAKLHAVDYSFSSENAAVRTKYTNTSNIRVGAEVRLQPFSIRGGFALYGSPYKNGVNSGGQKQTFSLGLGYRGNGFYVDVAYIYSVMKEDYYLYDPQIVPPSKNTTTASTVMLTVGIKY